MLIPLNFYSCNLFSLTFAPNYELVFSFVKTVLIYTYKNKSINTFLTK
ncbi:hypothetical protein ES703_71390 [subsurface metagenome]